MAKANKTSQGRRKTRKPTRSVESRKADSAELEREQEALIEQYKELCSDSRHYDQKLWLIPSAAYTTSALFYNALFNINYDINVRIMLASLNVMIFSGFLLQYIKDRAFQLELQSGVTKVQEKILGMMKISQYSAILSSHPQDRWHIKLFRKTSASNYVFSILLITLLAHFGVLTVLVLEKLKII
ncbi:MAG: hypothetical protein HZB50_14500 [Chloroflexi bacterium]|nr:hypothetical protein [Chloroflexota bacterium]